MTKRLVEILILTGFTLLALVLYKSTASFPEVTQGSTATYIRFLAVCLASLCLVELFLNMKKNQVKGGQEAMHIASAPGKFWSLLILMFIYAMLLEPLGFYIASVLFMPLTMYLLGARKPFAIGLTSLGVLVFVFLVFGKLLGVPLPESTILASFH